MISKLDISLEAGEKKMRVQEQDKHTFFLSTRKSVPLLLLDMAPVHPVPCQPWKKHETESCDLAESTA